MRRRPRPASLYSRAVLDALRHIVRALRLSATDAERQVGISGAQLFVLRILADSPPLSATELAERTLTHQSSVSVVVRRLVERGLARRKTSPEDARRVEITCTAAGRAVIRRAPASAQAHMIAALERLPLALRKSLAKGITELVREMGVTWQVPALFFEDEGAQRPRKRRSG